MVFLNYLLKNGKSRYLYTFSLTVILFINMQQSYCMLIFIIIYSGLYVHFNLPKSDLKAVVFRLGFYTLLALLISCVILVLAAYQITTSQRLSGNIIYKIKEIFRSNANPETNYTREKWILFITCFIPISLSVIMTIRNIYRKKNIK